MNLANKCFFLNCFYELIVYLVTKPQIALYMIFWYTDWSSSIQQLFEFFNYALWANKIFSCTYKQEEIAKCYKNKVCM